MKIDKTKSHSVGCWDMVTYVIETIFPERKGMREHNVDGVDFDYVNSGSLWNTRFGGILLRVTDGNYKTVIRSVKLKKDDELNLEAVRSKFEELKSMNVEFEKKRSEIREKDVKKYQKEQDLRGRIVLNDGEFICCSKDDDIKYNLQLNKLTEDQVVAVCGLINKLRKFQ